MPPIAKPKDNRITKLAKAVKARSPLPKVINDAILPTDVPTDVAGLMPTGTEIQAGASMLSPLISIYKDKASREAATQEFLDSVRHFTNINASELPDHVRALWANAAESFTSKYPRIAAHVRQSPHLGEYRTNTGASAGAAVDTPIDRVKEPLTLSLFRPGSRVIAKDPNAATDMMHHEMTHVAQSLGNRDADPLYWAADDVVGYQYNPFETSARLAGAKAVTGAPRVAKDPRGIGRSTIAAALAHPANLNEESQKYLMGLLRDAEQHGLWDLIPGQINMTPEKWPGAIPMARKVAEYGLAQKSPKAQMGGVVIKSILGARERTPMAPTVEELAKMPLLKRMARQMKSR